jgi:hypothetical protein
VFATVLDSIHYVYKPLSVGYCLLMSIEYYYLLENWILLDGIAVLQLKIDTGIFLNCLSRVTPLRLR